MSADLRPPRPGPQRTQRWKLSLLNVFPPYLGAGVRVRRLADDPLVFESTMKLRWWNRNYFATHFGGSLYSLCDPFFALILVEALGPHEFIVWDKAAAVRFRRPGTGTVRARFAIPRERIEEIRTAALAADKVEPQFTVQVLDEQDRVVAEVDKLLHVRHRRRFAATDATADSAPTAADPS